MSTDLSLLDSNVLVYAFYAGAKQHNAARELLYRATSPDACLCVAAQNLSEFYSVITDSRRVTQPRRPEDAAEAIAMMLSMPGLVLLPTPSDLTQRWMNLLRQRPVRAGAIFDLQLVATMLANDVRRIYTYDERHFRPFAQIEVLTP